MQRHKQITHIKSTSVWRIFTTQHKEVWKAKGRWIQTELL